MVQGFYHSVLGLPISLGAIQKVIDRASEATLPHYEAIRDKARSSKVNHIDETPWYDSGGLHWLWVMVSPVIAFFMVHGKRVMTPINQDQNLRYLKHPILPLSICSRNKAL
ncbi:MAG: transposase [Deltaproteobacteria bacterium]|nr:transposase [Deltaproteobacteria bacterium]MBW2069083.1 transposase [Deltaproteobacteria bacterium]